MVFDIIKLFISESIQDMSYVLQNSALRTAISLPFMSPTFTLETSMGIRRLSLCRVKKKSERDGIVSNMIR